MYITYRQILPKQGDLLMDERDRITECSKAISDVLAIHSCTLGIIRKVDPEVHIFHNGRHSMSINSGGELASIYLTIHATPIET